MLKLFPYFIIRTTGVDYAELNEFNQMGLISAMADIRSQLKTKRTIIENGCDLIYNFIKPLQDPIIQKKLLNIKRNLFNDRPLTNKEKDFIDSLTDTEFVSALNAFLTLVQDIDSKLISGKERFENIITVNRVKFKNKIKGNEQLKNGLLLSSLEITKVLDQYIDLTIELPSKKEQSLELSLTKYFARACTKPSPFSTFTTLSLGRAFASGPPVSVSYTADYKTYSIVRYNNVIFKIFSDLLLNYYPFYSKLCLKLNPSITKKKSYYSFFINFHNNEAFQRVDRDPLLNWVITTCSKSNLDYKSLLNKTVKAVGDDLNSANQYLQSLINIGILEFCYPISLIKPDWEKDFSVFLTAGVRDNLLDNIAENLRTMYDLRKLYESNFDYDERKNILNKVHLIIYQIYECIFENIPELNDEKLSVEEFFLKTNIIRQQASPQENTFFKRNKNIHSGVKKEKCLFEDTKLDIDFLMNADSSKKLENLLPLINNLSKSLLGNLHPKVFTLFFLEEYGETLEVSLLDCYELYYRRKGKLSDMEWGSLFSKDIDKATDEKNINEVEEQLGDYLTTLFSKSSESGHINLESENLISILNHQETNGANRNSYGAFIQPVFSKQPKKNDNDVNTCKFIVNHWITEGYGKFFGRFLHLFDQEVTAQLLAFNISDSDKSIHCENSDGAIFNANLHPPLMQAEFNIPGGYNSYATEKIININNLKLSYNKDSRSVVLKYNDLQVSVFDLGFQTPAGRSLLFNFFYNFNKNLPTGNILCVFINNLYYKLGAFKKNIGEEVFFPRITIDDFLIVQRMQWRFYLQDLPQLNEKQSFYEKFDFIEQWRLKYNLPQQFFVRHSRDEADKNIELKHKKKQINDDYKPVFINFDNFLLVNVLIKMILNVESYISIEEVLPGKDEFLDINSKSFASEFVVQWYE